MWEYYRKQACPTLDGNVFMAGNIKAACKKMGVVPPEGMTSFDLRMRNTPEESKKMALGCIFAEPRPIYVKDIWVRAENFISCQKQMKLARTRTPRPVAPTRRQFPRPPKEILAEPDYVSDLDYLDE